MKNPLAKIDFSRIFSRKSITIGGITTGILVLTFACATAYYYVTTAADTIIVTTTEIPAGLPTNFTQNNLTDHVVAHLQRVFDVAAGNDGQELVRHEGLGPRSVKQRLIPVRAYSNVPSPIFDLTWKGINLNLCRRIGMSLKAKGVLELGAIGLPDKGWRLTALLKEGSHFMPLGSAPRLGGACSDFENCADDLTEQVQGSIDSHRLLQYYIKINNKDANSRVIELYETLPASSLQADDLIAWGNAYYNLGKFTDALQKYQDALDKDRNSCPAQVARGFVYYSLANATSGTARLAYLRRAEPDFRAGILCDTRNEYTRTSLCHTLLLEWTNSPIHDPQLLVQAREQCEEALKINPQFVIAAVNIGYILYQQAQRTEALQYFENLSQRYPTHSALFLNYGFLLYLEYLKDHNPDTLAQATAQTLQAWNRDEHSDVAATNLGYFYYEQDRNDKAMDFWNKATSLAPDDPDVIAGLALGNYKLGQQTQAITLLARAIQIDPQYRDLTYLREKHYWSDRAASDLAKLIKLLPTPAN
jgi:tetratricopeptide (TPR) repeat protein